MSTHPEPQRGLAARVRETSGVTLIELIIAITIVGIAVTGTLLSINRSVRSSADPLVVQQGLVVAEAYLEEILLKPYYDPDPNSAPGPCPAPEPNGRPEYNNVCDYHGLDDAGARDQDENAGADLALYRVRVVVDPNATLGVLSGPADVIRADVRVTHPQGIDVTLSGYNANY